MFYDQIEEYIHQLLKKINERPLYVGLNAPQGAGKTTLSTELTTRFRNKNKNLVAISIDDFYLTHAEQKQLANEHPENPYLQQRGYPGTHDIELGIQTLKDPRLIPRYDKSAHQGQGDRKPKDQWQQVHSPIDVIVLEGWMLGFYPTTAAKSDPYMKTINEKLKDYSPWYDFFHGFIYLQAEDPSYVLNWRLEAEQNMRAKGLDGMSDEEVKAYAEKFLPAYSFYQDTVFDIKKRVKHFLHFTLGSNRLPITNSD